MNLTRITRGVNKVATFAISCGILMFFLLGYQTAKSAVSSSLGALTGVAPLVSQMRPNDIKVVTLTADEVCAVIKMSEKDSGSFCTGRANGEIAVVLSGSNNEGRNLLAVLDPTGRATHVNILSLDKWSSFTLQDRGEVSVAIIGVGDVPEEVRLLDANGISIQIVHPQMSYINAQEGFQELLAHPDKNNHR